MKTKFELIRELLFKYNRFGIKKTMNGATLIGHPDYLKENWWLVELFPQLNIDDIASIEKEVSVKLPESYVYFLRNISNGLIFQFGTFALYGYVPDFNRNIECRLPFDMYIPNIYERENISNLRQNSFVIGGYDYDGSQLYMDTNTGRVFLCSNTDSTPLYHWETFEDMLLSELKRLYCLYTEDGRCIDDSKTTLPI